jgi:hypothetical protein
MSIFAGMTGLIIASPFAKTLSRFRGNHFSRGVPYHFITHSYLWLIIGYENLRVSMQHVIGFGIVLILLSLVVAFVRLHSRVMLRLPRAEAAFVLILSAFPVLAYLLAVFVTHFAEARYVQPAMIGITALFAILMAPLLQNKTVGRIVLVSLFVAIAGTGVLHIRSEKEQSQRMMASLVLSPMARHNLERFPDQPIYVVNHSVFEFVHYYSPNADIRSRIALLFPIENEFKYSGVGADTSQQVVNMRDDGVPNVEPYELVAVHGTESLFVLHHYSWEWTDRALAESHAKITYLGPAYGGDLVSVRFP